MVLSVALAWWFPSPGAKGGALHPEVTNKLGVALIFFLHGLSLSIQALTAGILRWPAHVIVQLTTFVFFPLVGVALLHATTPILSAELRLGVFYLCALPSTVSSSIAFTALARGNVAVAVVNATLSSIAGVLITPLWVAAVLGAIGATIPLGDVVLDLTCWLLLPLVLGQLARPFARNFVQRNRRYIAVVDRCTILLLVYTSFCDSVKEGVWSEHGIAPVVAIVLISALLLALMMFATSVLGRAAKLPVDERIAAIFCGSKKSLASGVPMARLLFGSHPALGVILLPILVYHALQLLVAGWLASRWSRRPAD